MCHLQHMAFLLALVQLSISGGSLTEIIDQRFCLSLSQKESPLSSTLINSYLV